VNVSYNHLLFQFSEIGREKLYIDNVTRHFGKMYAIENEKGYWQNELSSLGIECKRSNELNDNEELATLATALKEVYFQDYKTAYDSSNTEIIDKSHFDYIV